MKMNKLIKLAACTMMLAGGVALGNAVQPAGSAITAQAKSKSTKVVKVSYKNLSKKAYHLTTGTLYTTSHLTKVAHYGVHYKSTTFYTYKQGTVKRANGKKAVYYYVKSSNSKVKGWIWHSYLKKGAAKKTTSTKPTTTTSTKPASTTSTPNSSSTGTKAPITSLVNGASSTTNNGGNTSTGTSTTPDAQSVQVVVYGPMAEGNPIYASGLVKVENGATAFSVLQQVCKTNGVPLSYTGSGSTIYVTSINGKNAGTGGVGGGWLVSVNGKFLDASAGTYAVHPGDIVNWEWTQTAGDRGGSF